MPRYDEWRAEAVMRAQGHRTKALRASLWREGHGDGRIAVE
jgi:hypothetical protein